MDCSNPGEVRKRPIPKHFNSTQSGGGANKQQVGHIMDAIWKGIPGRSEHSRAELLRQKHSFIDLRPSRLPGKTVDAGTVTENGNTIGVFMMEQSQDIADALTTLIKLVVDHPDGVRVERVPITDGVSLRVSVDPADTGKVIGKQGRTARSLRILMTAMGMASKQRISLDIQE